MNKLLEEGTKMSFEEVKIVKNSNGKGKKESKIKTDIELNFEVEQVQWFDSHYYSAIINGAEKAFPSSTTILNASPKPFLSHWRGNLGNQAADAYMKEKQQFGTNVHNAAEAIARGFEVVYCKPGETINDFENKYILYDQYQYLHVSRFLAFLNELKIKSIETEQIVYDFGHEYAGTLDYAIDVEAGEYNVNGAKPIALEDGIYIADLKSGSNIYAESYMQLASYIFAYEKMFPALNVKGGLIIHTDASTKKGIEGLSVKLITLEEAQVHFQNFLKVYEVWKINPNPAEPKFFTMPKSLIWRNPITK